MGWLPSEKGAQARAAPGRVFSDCVNRSASPRYIWTAKSEGSVFGFM